MGGGFSFTLLSRGARKFNTYMSSKFAPQPQRLHKCFTTALSGMFAAGEFTHMRKHVRFRLNLTAHDVCVVCHNNLI